MRRKIGLIRLVVAGIMVMVASLVAVPAMVSAASGHGVTMSPMMDEIILHPGETYTGSFMISNPASETEETYYEISVESFYADEKGETVFDVDGDMASMAKWIKIDSPTTGSIEPNETKNINYEIEVPNNAPGGGQYATILVSMKDKEGNGKEGKSSSGATIEENWRIAYLIYAEVAGDTVRSGDILDAEVPGFLFSGKIKGTATVKNTGNVHGKAKYTLKVFPLFSSEEVYTNEENPATKMILPDREVYNEVAWDNTPSIGIFNVVYTVDFEGSKAEVSKMVIACPVWLLFIIFFVIIMLIIWIVMRVRKAKTDKARRANEK